ncbi:MAG: pyrroline-5-carboxylate reductase family protein, partial [Acutalibacteraceae bacterium]
MLGFIGTGNMATAIIKGIVSSGFLKGNDIGVFDVIKEKAEDLSAVYGVKVFGSANELCKSCEKIVLSVKPNVFGSLLPQISETVKEKSPLIISIAAGKTLEFIGSLLDESVRIVRVMPNINAVVAQAVC